MAALRLRDLAGYLGATALAFVCFVNSAQGVTETDHGSAGNDGTYQGGVSYGLSGIAGRAVGFDGVDGLLFLGAEDLAGDWTVETVLQASDNAANASQGIIGGGTSAIKAEQWQNTGSLGYTVFGVIDVDLGVAFPTSFSHLAFVHTDGVGVELFVDGAAAGSAATGTALARDVIGHGRVGVDALLGAIDELAIYDRALGGSEISDHAAALAGGESAVHSAISGADPLNWYQFNAPEPSSILLMVLGGLSLAAWKPRRQR